MEWDRSKVKKKIGIVIYQQKLHSNLESSRKNLSVWNCLKVEKLALTGNTIKWTEIGGWKRQIYYRGIWAKDLRINLLYMYLALFWQSPFFVNNAVQGANEEP